MLTKEIVDELLSYDPETGKLTWKVAGKGIKKLEAGGRMANGYISIGIKGKRYLAHRIIWLLLTGSFPEFQLDHINGDRADNKLSNLRPCSNSENNQNFNRLRTTNTSGYRNVFSHADGWLVQLKVNNRAKYIGWYKDKQLAIAASEQARKQYMPFSQN